MNTTITALLVSVVLFSATSAEAQNPVRVRGSIATLSGDVLTVKSREGTISEIQLTPKTTIVSTSPIALSDIKPNDFVGVAATKRPDGTLVAAEVRRFPAPSNEGHRPSDFAPGSTMTNATVSATVQAAEGHELVLTYKGGSQKIIVPQNLPISELVDVDRSALVPGAEVNLSATADAQGKLAAQRVQVSRPAAKPY
ncbi:MAG TPA: DUF5666 domain-containing protein [Burkholderiales bacterium]|jgi:hypothetical protein|nr:DUF5666 domain-containing protein [Burkholderiales bacterium]